MTVSVVIVTFNGWDVLCRCLTALAVQTRRPDEIVVVDNGSADETVRNLPNRFPDVRLLEAGRNLGFAAGNNLGIQRAGGDVVVLLNNDTLPDPAFIEEVVRPLECDGRVGSVAGTMVFSQAPRIVASAGISVYRNGLALDQGLGMPVVSIREDSPVFGPSAGAAAYRRAALEDVGLFPESFFMYLEDVDLAWRLRLRGWTSVVVPGALAQHDYSASSVEGSAFKRRLLARNRAWVTLRCWPSDLLRASWTDILAYDLMAFGYGLLRRDWPAIGGRVAALRTIRTRLAERRAIQSRMTADPDALLAWLRPSPPAREVLRLRKMAGTYATRGGR